MIPIKSEKDIKIMKEGGKILSSVIADLKTRITPGVTTSSLNHFAEREILKKGGKPSFKGYRGFPATLCTSINEVIVHGVPSDYILKEGDIITLDCGVFYKGFHTDMAITIPVGRVEEETLRIIRETKKALKRGIKKSREGNTFGDVGNTVFRHITKAGFSVVRGLCGHGIGKEIHEEPQVLNEGKRGKGVKIEKGMVFCIEPMASMGSPNIKDSSDGFGIETEDRSLSVQFEHTIAITEDGCQVLTEI